MIGADTKPYTLPVAYTPTVTNGTSTGVFSNTFWWKNNKWLYAQGYYAAGSGADGAATRLEFVVLPSGLAVDTTIIVTDLVVPVGWARYFKNGTGEYSGTALARTTGTVYLCSGSTVNAFLGSNLASGDTWSWSVRLPILGWS